VLSGNPPTGVTIIDGVMVVNMLRAFGYKTLGDYASKIIVPYRKTALSDTVFEIDGIA